MDPILPIDGKRYCRDHWSKVGKNNLQDQIPSLSKDTALLASDIISNPDQLDELSGRYVLVADQTVKMKNVKFNDVQRAMNMMAERGWRCVNISSVFAPVNSGVLCFYALMERLDTTHSEE